MFSVPERGSSGCVLLIAAALLGLLGGGFAIGSIYGLLAADGGSLANIASLAMGLVLLVIAVIAYKSATAPTTPQGLFTSGADAMESLDLAKSEKEKSLALRTVNEASGKAGQLTAAEREVLDRIKANIKTIPSAEEVTKTLHERADGRLALANPALQPIAFAIKPTTASRYAKGVVIELLVWTGVILSTPFLLVWGMYVYDLWRSGKAVLYKALRWSRQAKRYRVRPHNIFQHDQRAPVLYLRSFLEDYEADLESYFATTPEEHLAQYYKSYGPVIAIGQPQEELPLLGASRIYFDNSTWQAGVLHLMSVSQMVIIHAGFSPGLFWELGVARQRVEPQRLIISFKAWEGLDEWQRHLSYVRFKKYAEPLLECELPADTQAVSHLTFEADWVPKPLPRVIVSRET